MTTQPETLGEAFDQVPPATRDGRPVDGPSDATCPACNGTGVFRLGDDTPTACLNCLGTGYWTAQGPDEARAQPTEQGDW